MAEYNSRGMGTARRRTGSCGRIGAERQASLSRIFAHFSYALCFFFLLSFLFLLCSGWLRGGGASEYSSIEERPHGGLRGH